MQNFIKKKDSKASNNASFDAPMTTTPAYELTFNSTGLALESQKEMPKQYSGGDMEYICRNTMPL